MKNKLCLLMITACVAIALPASHSSARGGFHRGYTHVGPNGVFHAGQTAGFGPNGAFSTGHAGFYGAGGNSYHAGYARGINDSGDVYRGAAVGGTYYGGAHYAYPNTVCYGGGFGAGMVAGAVTGAAVATANANADYYDDPYYPPGVYDTSDSW